MELPVTVKGNQYVIVFQDLLVNGQWYSLHQIRRQNIYVAWLLVEEIIPILAFQKLFYLTEEQICCHI